MSKPTQIENPREATTARAKEGNWLKIQLPRVQSASITFKLAMIVAILVLASVGLLAVVAVASDILTGVRAFIGSEGLYSRGQKDAAYHLSRYVHTRSEEAYQRYLRAIAIPLGDQAARVELLKSDFDYDTVVRGFVQGGIAEDDIPHMISIFRRFRDVSYMKQAIESWQKADLQVVALAKCGDEVRRAIDAGSLRLQDETAFLQRIDQINIAATPLEQEFAAKLGEAAREVRRLLGWAILLAAALLMSGALWLSWRFVRELRIGILNLRKAAIKVGDGDLDHRVEVPYSGELGELATVFNQMLEHRRGTELEMKTSAEFLEKVLNNVSNAIYMIDMEGRFILVNRRMCTMTGYAESELVGMLFDELFLKERLIELRKLFDHIVHDGMPLERYETPLVRKDKLIITMSFSSVPFYKDGKIVGLVGAAEDVTERLMHDARIARLANYDTLTELPNRNLLNDRIARALTRAPRMDTAVALIFMDIDGFKFINDSMGHSVGDELLKQVAFMLKGSIRDEDTVSRLGGDEFVILLSDIDDELVVLNFANNILGAFMHPFFIHGRELYVTVSIGICFYPRDGLNHETLLMNADIAMYKAKEAGRNCMKSFLPEMASKSVQRVELEAAMRAALDNQDFELHYQPQLDLKTGKICSAEALMRWRHVKLGMVPPGRFIPLAEETGLIMPMGDWALKTACQELKIWHQMGYSNLSVAVNISAHQIQRQDLQKIIQQILSDTGIPPDKLHLELTEGVILQNSNVVIKTLKELKALGVVLELDDFGTGFSSLSYLNRFPIDIIKIDQSFTLNLRINPEATAIICAIISMAKSLGMKTVAEGVETKEQLDFLTKHECDAIQGFYLSHALPAEEFRTLLSRESAVH